MVWHYLGASLSLIELLRTKPKHHGRTSPTYMTPAQKKTFFNDVCYVIQQAKAYHDYTRDGHQASLRGHPFQQVIENAILESSLAFLRKANEFFGKNSDASVRAFFPDYTLQWLWDKSDSDFLNERVMHLSLCEAKDGKHDWTNFYSTHLPEVERRFAVFIKRVSHEHPDLFNNVVQG